jgi:hypothetical protein
VSNCKIAFDVFTEAELYELELNDFIEEFFLDYDERWCAWCEKHAVTFRDRDYDAYYRSFMEQMRDERYNA